MPDIIILDLVEGVSNYRLWSSENIGSLSDSTKHLMGRKRRPRFKHCSGLISLVLVTNTFYRTSPFTCTKFYSTFTIYMQFTS